MRATLWTALGALLSHWRRRPIQLAALVLGLAAATALWSGVQALNGQARDSYARSANMLGGAETSALIPRSGDALDAGLFGELRRAGWKVSPAVDGRVWIPLGPDLSDGARRLRVLGLDPITAPDAVAAASFGGGLEENGDAVGASEEASANPLLDFMSGPGLGLVAPQTYADLVKSGVDPPTTRAGRPLPPLRAVQGIAPGVVVVDIGVAQDLLDMRGELSRLLLDETAPEGLTPWESAGGGALRRVDGVVARSGGDLDRLTDSFHLNLTAFGLLSFAVGLFIANAAVGLAFEQRKPLMRTLRAVGVSARQLTAALLIEILVFALFAGVLGVFGGYAVAAALLPDVAASLRGLYGAEVSGALTLDAGHWMVGLGMSFSGALLAATASLWRAWRLPVLATAQPAAWVAGQAEAHRWQSAAGLALFATAAAATAFGEGLLMGFVGLSGLLLGAALLAPPLLAFALRWLEGRALGPLMGWAAADARQQLSGLSLALMALLLALSANIGVGAMVESFRGTFLGWLDQRLSAEIYVVAANEAEAARLKDWSAAHPDVRAVLPTAQTETRIGGLPVGVVGFRDHATFRENWPLLNASPRVWEDVAAGDAVIVSEQLARRLDLWTGDILMAPAADGALWKAPVAGVYADYGNPLGQFSANIAAVLARYPAAERLSFGLRADANDVDAVLDDLTETFGAAAARATDQATLKRYSRDVFNQTFAVTAALNTLTLGVAGLALLTSLAALSSARAPALAPLWAIGVTRAQLGRLEVLKSLGLALLTALLAVPLGLLLAWHLLAVVNVQAFGWRLPLQFFPTEWLRLGLLACLTAGLATLPALWRLRRIAPAELARTFAQERG